MNLIYLFYSRNNTSSNVQQHERRWKAGILRGKTLCVNRGEKGPRGDTRVSYQEAQFRDYYGAKEVYGDRHRQEERRYYHHYQGVHQAEREDHHP